MWYAILGWDNRQSAEQRQQFRAEHLERLESLKAQGKLLLAGPLPAIDNDETASGEITGSLIIAAFDSQEQAQDWIDEDPYTKAHVYQKVEIFPFVKRMP